VATQGVGKPQPSSGLSHVRCGRHNHGADRRRTENVAWECSEVHNELTKFYTSLNVVLHLQVLGPLVCSFFNCNVYQPGARGHPGVHKLCLKGPQVEYILCFFLCCIALDMYGGDGRVIMKGS
jgi:hypothetical protein